MIEFILSLKIALEKRRAAKEARSSKMTDGEAAEGNEISLKFKIS